MIAAVRLDFKQDDQDYETKPAFPIASTNTTLLSSSREVFAHGWKPRPNDITRNLLHCCSHYPGWDHKEALSMFAFATFVPQ